jgi:hypothetical protein
VARVRGLIPEGVDLKELVNIYAFNILMAWEADRVDPWSMTSMSIAAFLGERGHPTASVDGTARVHALKIHDLMALAWRRVTRSLTPAECQRYLRQDPCPPTVMTLGLIVEGNRRAMLGDVEAVAASFQKAQELDPTLVVEPEAEASALTVASLIAISKSRARAGDDGISANKLATLCRALGVSFGGT